jgi:hypothetical protein
MLSYLYKKLMINSVATLLLKTNVLHFIEVTVWKTSALGKMEVIFQIIFPNFNTGGI